MRGVAKDFSGLGLTEISRTVCELLEWKRPNGGLKNLECRQLLERLCARGLLSIPELRDKAARSASGAPDDAQRSANRDGRFGWAI
jgi:hypothetical protein